MKVILLNGSARKNGNTNYSLEYMSKMLNEADIETEIVHVGSYNVKGCIGCGACFKARNNKCVVFDDEVNEVLEKIKECDGLVLGSPVYYAGMSGAMKNFLDRMFYVNGANGNHLRHKVGASVVAVRRMGGMPTLNGLNHYLTYSEMVLATSNYWNVTFGNQAGDLNEDVEGKQLIEVLTNNMIWLLKTVNESKVKKPEKVKKAWTNFIR